MEAAAASLFSAAGAGAAAGTAAEFALFSSAPFASIGVGGIAGSSALATSMAGTFFGGMSGIGLGSLMQGASLLTSVAGGLSAGQAAEYSAMAQAEGMKAQAYMEKQKAEEEAIMRRERLLKALASQSAYSGAAGVRGGSVDALRLESIDQFRQEQRAADVMAKTNQDVYQQKIAGSLLKGKYEKQGEYLSTATRLLEIG